MRTKATAKNPARTSRKRTVEEILAGFVCGPTEAMRVLNVRYAEVVALVETGRVHSFRVGRRTKISVESLKKLANGEAENRQDAA